MYENVNYMLGVVAEVATFTTGVDYTATEVAVIRFSGSPKEAVVKFLGS